jgi:hypothetical protein
MRRSAQKWPKKLEKFFRSPKTQPLRGFQRLRTPPATESLRVAPQPFSAEPGKRQKQLRRNTPKKEAAP